MKNNLTAAFSALMMMASTALASAQTASTVPASYRGIWQTKEWFGTIANMQFVPCDNGPYCVQVVSLAKGDGMKPGSYFMTDLKLKGRDMRDGKMRIPNGPTFGGNLIWKNDRQIELQILFQREIWERVR